VRPRTPCAPRPARTFYDDLDQVKYELGVRIVSGDEAGDLITD
jgi:hypothetical protein